MDRTLLPVLALRYIWRNTAFVTLHNFADQPHTVHVDVNTEDGGRLCDLFDEDHSCAADSGRHDIALEPYMHKWYRVGGSDTTLKRSHF